LIVEGNVGIGTASPTSYGHGGTNKFLNILNSDTTVNAQSHLILSTGNVANPGTIGTITFAVPNTAHVNKFASIIAAGIESDSSTSINSYLAFYTTANGAYNNRLHISSTGNVVVTNLAGTGNRAVYSDANGVLTNSSSDQSLKTNVTDIPYGLSQVLALNPIKFNWTQEANLGIQPEIGFIAQEVQSIIPEVIGINSNDLLSLDYPKLTAVLCKAIQELNQKLENYINGKLQ